MSFSSSSYSNKCPTSICWRFWHWVLTGSINIYTKEVHFCFVHCIDLLHSGCSHIGLLFTNKDRNLKGWLTYLILLPHIPALHLMSLIQTAGHKVAALTVMFSQPGSRDSSVVRGSDSWSKGHPGSSPSRSGGRILFARVNFLCWLLFRYPFHPYVTAVARKRSRSFCQKHRWQVTAKHTYTLSTWLWMMWHCKLVHGWMVYTELVPRWQHFTWHQPCSNQRALPVHHFHGC